MAKQLRWALLMALCFEAAWGAFDDGICNSIVQKYGYPCREYTVTTKDGYILSMQRISRCLFDQCLIVGKGEPVLLQHGLFMDGMTWLMSTPEQSLAYILADNGFDVWISNTRGTRWSRGHTSLQANDPAYWNWSWDELVLYDLPSFTEFVHLQTRQKFHYVGHSLGTLTALASLSQGNLGHLLKSAALLCPIAHLSHMTSPYRLASAPLFGQASGWLAMPEFNPRGNVVSKLINSMCMSPEVNCSDLLSAFTGSNCCLNSFGVKVYFDYELQSTSTKNIIHLGQMIQGDTIAMYDYGSSNENMWHYGQNQPPMYDMSCIPKDFPLFLSYGGKDIVSDAQDVKILLEDLRFHDGDKLMTKFLQNYAHMDFVMATNAKQSVYYSLVNFFDEHSMP